MTIRDRSDSPRSTKRFKLASASACGFALVVAVLAMALAAHVRAAETITWASFQASILRVDDEPPKDWNLYRDTRAKGDDVLLLQWGKRYVRLNTRLKEAREMDPQSFTHKSNKLTSPADDGSGKILATAGWIVRDVGSASRVYFELTDENHKIDINLPHGGR